MKKMTIFRFIRDPKNFGKILGKETLRVINTHESFVGIGAKGEVNKAEFRKLADALEPFNDGISLS
jgi:hypothetical protein